MMWVVMEKVKGSFDRYAKLLPFPGPHLCPWRRDVERQVGGDSMYIVEG